MDTTYKIVIAAILIVSLLIIKGIYDERLYKKRLYNRLKNTWGQPSGREYSNIITARIYLKQILMI